MGTCNSVIQNRCRMQGRCVFGRIPSTACVGESDLPMTLVRKGDKAESSAWTCAKSDIEQFFDLGFVAAVKMQDFHGLYILP